MTGRYFHSRRLPALLVLIIFAWGAAAPAHGQGVGQISALKEHDTVQPIDITADRLEVRESENLAIFEGAVEAIQGDLNIYAETVTVYYEAAGESLNPTIIRLDLTGGVRLVTPSEDVEAEWVVYDVQKRLLTLGGAVRLQRGETLMRGERLELDLKTGNIKFGGADDGTEAPQRVHGRFTIPADDQKSGDNR